MSFGLIPPITELNIFITSGLFKSAAVTGTEFSRITPSNTHNGSALPEMVAVPRIRILGAAPGAADVFTTESPGTTPCNICSILDAPIVFSSLVFTVTTELVKLRFSICWYPVTTISPILSASSSNTTTKAG